MLRNISKWVLLEYVKNQIVTETNKHLRRKSKCNQVHIGSIMREWKQREWIPWTNMNPKPNLVRVTPYATSIIRLKGAIYQKSDVL